VKQILASVRSLGVVEADIVRELKNDFAMILNPKGGVVGEDLVMERIINTSLSPEQRDSLQILEPNAYDKVEKLPNSLLAEQLLNERPAIIAVLFSKLSEQKVLQLLQLLPIELTKEILMSFSQVKPIQNDASQKIMQALDETLIKRVNDLDNSMQIKKTATLIESLAPSMMEDILDNFELKNKDLAAQLREEVLTFESLVELNETTLFKILQDVPHKTIAAALHDATPSHTEFFLHHLSENASMIIEEEIELNNTINENAVWQAKREILDRARIIIRGNNV
jgi:flagellar motor switch protein FliG